MGRVSLRITIELDDNPSLDLWKLYYPYHWNIFVCVYLLVSGLFNMTYHEVLRIVPPVFQPQAAATPVLDSGCIHTLFSPDNEVCMPMTRDYIIHKLLFLTKVIYIFLIHVLLISIHNPLSYYGILVIIKYFFPYSTRGVHWAWEMEINVVQPIYTQEINQWLYGTKMSIIYNNSFMCTS